jgi:hypothetical protein
VKAIALYFTLLFIAAILLPVSTCAQVVRSYTLDWLNPASPDAGDSLLLRPSFSGAVYEGSEWMPVWTETIFDPEVTGTASLAKCTFAPLTENEQASFPLSLRNVLKALPDVQTRFITSRKSGGIRVELIPFRKNPVSGEPEKLLTFSLKFSGENQQAQTTAKNYAAHSRLSQGTWYRLQVTQTGIYSLDYNDLAALGIDVSAVNPSKIGVFGRGGAMLPESNAVARPDDLPELSIEVTGGSDGSFDPGDRILFYAEGPDTWQYSPNRKFWEHTRHLYADTISYFLSTDQGSGKHIALSPGSQQTATDMVDAFDFYTCYEKDNINLIKSGRQWFAESFEVITNRSYSFDIPPLTPASEVSFRTVTAAASVNASSFVFTVGNQSWNATHSAISLYPNNPVASGTTAYKTLQTVTLPLNLGVSYTKTSPSAAGYLDLIDLNARCALRYSSGQLAFRDAASWGAGRTALYRIASAAGKAGILEVTDPQNPKRIQASTDGGDLVFRQSSDTLRQYIAFDEKSVLKPIPGGKVPNQDLHAFAGADMIILTAPEFFPQAVRLATFHNTQSDLSVEVLTPRLIYNEFSSGTPDITAIRDFMKMLYDRSPSVKMPDYLLLFGDASYDYKDKVTANTNFIPSWQSPESYSPISSLVSDDYYGMLDENEGQSYSDLIDLGIGRLPVKNLQEAEEAVDKIIRYSVPSAANNGDWRNVITFIADDEDLNDHIDQSEQMAQNIAANYLDFNIDKIYLDSYTQVAAPGGNRYPDVNKAISQRVEKGSLILNYTGHGGETGWAHEQVLTVNEINNWSNNNSLPVFVTATCEFSRFDDPQRQAAGEMVLTNPRGGGIALFTTTRPTYGTPNFELNKKFYQYALGVQSGKRLRMGDIIMLSKRDKGANENGRKYVLLGDPALEICFPHLHVVTTSINGKDPGAGADTLRALMEVTIEGQIADEQGNTVNDFSGTLFPSIYDKAVTIRTLANDGGAPYTFNLRKNLLYKGKVAVERGKFSFTFLVPRDISYAYGEGKVSYYATDGSRDASGSLTDVIIGGSADLNGSDSQGPEISLFMNNTLFRDGGITDQNPRLLARVSDENGINTVGSGIGHDITAVLDGNTSAPYILNDFYESDYNTFRSGYLWFPFSLLSAGEHTLTVKVWDILNNSSEAEIRFTVQLSGAFVITGTYGYPNPFRDYTDIVFEHNQQNVDFAVRAEIYTLTGQLVRVIEDNASQGGSVSTPVRWDGRNNQGSAVPGGMYFYKLYIRSSNGLSSETSGKLVYQK